MLKDVYHTFPPFSNEWMSAGSPFSTVGPSCSSVRLVEKGLYPHGLSLKTSPQLVICNPWVFGVCVCTCVVIAGYIMHCTIHTHCLYFFFKMLMSLQDRSWKCKSDMYFLNSIYKCSNPHVVNKWYYGDLRVKTNLH